MVPAPAKADEDEGFGKVGDPPFQTVCLQPWLTSGSALLDGCEVQLSQAAPLRRLGEVLARKLGLRPTDVTFLEDKRVLDSDQTLQEGGCCSAGSDPSSPVKLSFALCGHAAVSTLAVQPLAERWQKEMPHFAKRPPLAQAPHLVIDSAECPLLSAGACTTYGPRVSNEDTHLCSCNWATLSGSSNKKVPASLFAVCDGHGGSWVSKQLSERLAGELQLVAEESDWSDVSERRTAMETAFLSLDQRLLSEGGGLAQSCGSTCVAAIVWPEDTGGWHVLLANVGDSRGLLHRRGSDTLQATREHKADDPREKRRIRAAGGYVLPADPPQPARVDGVLACSRAFGDGCFKEPTQEPLEWKVTALPELYELSAQPGDFLVLACDGVFDVLSSEEVAALVECTPGNPVEAASTVVWAALQQDTQDNATCMVVRLQGPS